MLSIMESPPFLFTPLRERTESSAFSIAFKTLTVVVVSLALGWAWQMWLGGVLELRWETSGWMGAALGMMLYTQWFILRGVTVLDAQSIVQSWIWKKQVQLNDLAYAKLIHIRGLEWFIAPRLYTKTFSNKISVFYAADPSMLVEFHRLANELQAHRLKR